MATTIRETEAIPAAYPPTPSGLSTAAATLDPDVIWARIESYIAHRWTDREVIWTIDGCGSWSPPLTPATVTATEEWVDLAWVAVTPDASALLGGYVFDGDGPFRVTADVGSGTVPAAVDEAFIRLAEYSRELDSKAGVTSSLVEAGSVSVSHERSANWLARAMQNSGAADLLRPYRKV